MKYIIIKTEFIKLQQALKLARLVGEGSDAKLLIQDGQVSVNGEICLMRGKKLRDGDVFQYDGQTFQIKYEN